MLKTETQVVSWKLRSRTVQGLHRLMRSRYKEIAAMMLSSGDSFFVIM